MPKGWLDNLVVAKKKEFSVVRPIKASTIRQRVLNGKSLTPKHRGVVSPMAMAELAIVDVVVEFQKSRHLGTLEFEHGTLTKNWWLFFLRRHGHRLITKR